MVGAMFLWAAQVLVLAAPAAPVAARQAGHAATISAVATVQIVHAETTRADAGPRALKRQLQTDAQGRSSIVFE